MKYFKHNIWKNIFVLCSYERYQERLEIKLGGAYSSHYLGKKSKQGKLEHIEDNGFILKKK